MGSRLFIEKPLARLLHWVLFLSAVVLLVNYFTLFDSFTEPLRHRALTFVFDPSDAVYRANLHREGFAESPRIDHVEILGSFNNWKIPEGAHDRYRMREFPGGTYRIRLTLPEGTHAYKYRITTRDGKEVWTEDQRAHSFRPDGFGGRNSLTVVPSIEAFRWPGFLLLLLLLLLLAFGLSIGTIFSPALDAYLSLPLGFGTKRVLLQVVLSVAGILVWIGVNVAFLAREYDSVDLETMSLKVKRFWPTWEHGIRGVISP